MLFRSGQKITSYEQFPGDPEEEIKVVYERVLPPVTADIVGIDLDDPQRIEQRNNMTVPSAQGGVPNIQIYWYSTNATNCTCTKSTGEDCGAGASDDPRSPVFATEEGVTGPRGEYALTETTTFKVTCDP